MKTIDLLRTLEETGTFPSPALTEEERNDIEQTLRVVTIREGLGPYNGSFSALATRPASAG